MDPIIAAILTARIIPNPTASPNRGEVWSIRPASNAIISPHKKPKIVLYSVQVNPYCVLEPKTGKKPNKMECEVSSKKPN